MARINTDPLLPAVNTAGFLPQLYKYLRDIAQQLNGISEGRITPVTNKATAAPTTGTHAQGDKVWNSSPSELGSASSKYVIAGWICTVAGTPGTWLQMRVLTGN